MTELDTWRMSELEAARKRRRDNAEAWYYYHRDRREQLQRETAELVDHHRRQAEGYGQMLESNRIPEPEIPRDRAAWMG